MTKYIDTTDFGGVMNNELVKLRFRENAGSQVDSLSDEKKAIWRWQDDGAPPSPLDDHLEEA